ncbi:MAG: hypothetical protein VKN17_01795 [Cyanobacteriota bacterium]|nr:hypothetical protein [Cyanobacteriota bacterium]
MPAAPLLVAVAAPLAAATTIAATPLPRDAFVPFTTPTQEAYKIDEATGTESNRVQTFDPKARAQMLARQIPREWVGTYQSFASGGPVPVQLRLSNLTAVGQIVDLRGDITIGGVTSPVQGNLSAESDQLDLLVLGDKVGGGLQPGGLFQGLQGLAVSGWNGLRLTEMGGRLALSPVGGVAPAARSTQRVRGLW